MYAASFGEPSSKSLRCAGKSSRAARSPSGSLRTFLFRNGRSCPARNAEIVQQTVAHELQLEVAIEHEQVRVIRVVEAFDCGAVINPQGLRNQISGSIVQGLGGCLFESVHFENGQIQNAHLSGYRVPRFSDLPQIDVVIVNRKDQPSMGAGETPLIGIAAAVANAIFGATGVRLRSLPLAPRGMPASS